MCQTPVFDALGARVYTVGRRGSASTSQDLYSQGVNSVSDRASEREKGEILTRLRRVEGQIRGIQRMVEDERDCEAIVTQLLAARAALDKTGMLIMGAHIERCLMLAREGEGSGLDRVTSYFWQFARPPDADAEGSALENEPSQVG